MANCDGGYTCGRCGEYVPTITDSELYLRYVMGEVPTESLLSSPERHIRCCPEIAQYITDERFVSVVDEDPDSDKRLRPSEEVCSRELLVTAAWSRLQEVSMVGGALEEYLLPGLTPPMVKEPEEPEAETPRPRLGPENRIFW